jgi:uncharacterized repeat protein (TIGR02543 family)
MNYSLLKQSLFLSLFLALFHVIALGERLLWKSSDNRINDVTASLGLNNEIYVGPYALDSKTGQTVWELNTTVHFNHSNMNPGVGRDTPATVVGQNGRRYIVWYNLQSNHNSSSDKSLYAVDYLSGKTTWRYGGWQDITTSPALSSDGVLYFARVDDVRDYVPDGGSWGRIGRKAFALKASDGSHLWHETDDKGLLLPGILKGTNLDSSWNAFPYSTHIASIGNTGNVFLFNKGFKRDPRPAVECLRNNDGHHRWRISSPGDATHVSPITVDERDTIYFSSNSRTYAFDGSLKFGDENNGAQNHLREKWSFNGGSMHVQPIVGYGNKLYVGGAKDATSLPARKTESLFCLNRETGEKIWEFTIDWGGPFSTPALSRENTLYLTSGEGHFLYALDGDTGQKKWEYEIGPSMSSPLIDNNGTIYVGSLRGFYSLKGDAPPAETPWPMYKQNQRRTGQFIPPSNVVFVDDNASAGGDGKSWATAHKHLQDALANASSGDEIWVAEGTYKPDQGAGKTAGDRTVSFNLVNGVGMYGGFTGTETAREPLGDGNQTILSGEIDANSTLWSLHVVYGESLDSSSTIDGFHITKGNDNRSSTENHFGSGLWLITLPNNAPNHMGILKNSISPNIKNLVFSENIGIALGIYRSTPKVTNCIFINNGTGVDSSSSDGRGEQGYFGTFLRKRYSIFDSCTFKANSIGISLDKSSAVVGNCVFSQNILGMYSYSSKTILTECLFEENQAEDPLGPSRNSFYTSGIRVNNSTLDLFKCIFDQNQGYRNSVVEVVDWWTSINFVGCLFWGNKTIKSHVGRSGNGLVSVAKANFTNCTFVNNSVSGENIICLSTEADPKVTIDNCLFWGNLFEQNRSDIEGEWKSNIIESAVESQFPGDPNAKNAIYVTNSNIIQDWSGDNRAFSSDPLFVNVNDPHGPDEKWFTEDDGLRLQANSPAIDKGHNNSLTLAYIEKTEYGVSRRMSFVSADGEGSFDEYIKNDIAGYIRTQNSTIDIGAYEFGNSKVLMHAVSSSANPNEGGTISGNDSLIEEGKSTTISASPNTGYLFTGWSGDATGTTTPLTLTVDAAKSITANFAQDTSDTDGDGLSNYAELVTHGTKADDNDTDNDGLLDNEEVQIGTNPKLSDAALVNFFKAKSSTDQSTARTNALAEGRTAGIAAVKADPTAHNLVTKGAYDHMVEQLINSSDSGSTTPYTDGWFYYPNRGWMWTNRTSYPYFYDSSTKAWMYFKSGEDKPKFYHYGTKTWVTLGE